MKKNEIIPFGYDDQLVCTVIVNHVPWFVAKDVCAVLELSDVSMSVSKLDDDEKNTLEISEGIPDRGNPNMNIISESALYTLILRSNKPEASRGCLIKQEKKSRFCRLFFCENLLKSKNRKNNKIKSQ